MIRADLTGGAPNAMALATPGNGMVFQWRVNPGDASASTNPAAVFPGVAPYWIRLVRSGNTFAGYHSATGTTWILMGSTVVPMASAAYVGLAMTSHNPSLVTSATLSDVTVTAGSSQPPTLTQPANQTSAENATVSLQLLGRDTDGDTLTYRADGLPPALGLNAATGLISGTLTSTSAGTYSVIATVSDGLLSNSKTFTWTVTNRNRPPAHTRSDFDFDGDGRADLTVFRPSNGTWYVLQSKTNYASATGMQWGNGLDNPVPGDYDGDGKTDFAVFRPSNGTWYVFYSSTVSIVGVQWGNGLDVPVPGDFDGDGKIDIAVFRPSNGTWYLQYSSTGTTAGFQWGNGNDIPVPKRQSRSAGP